MPAEFLIAGLEHLLEPLVAFHSLAFVAATIPSVWREAMVVPVWKKKGDAKDISTYQPISLTCTGRRVHERLLLRDVSRFVHLLSDSQGGFSGQQGNFAPGTRVARGLGSKSPREGRTPQPQGSIRP